MERWRIRNENLGTKVYSLTCWWHQIRSQWITKMIRIHPLRIKSVRSRFHGNPSNWCRYIWFLMPVMDNQSQNLTIIKDHYNNLRNVQWPNRQIKRHHMGSWPWETESLANLRQSSSGDASREETGNWSHRERRQIPLNHLKTRERQSETQKANVRHDETKWDKVKQSKTKWDTESKSVKQKDNVWHREKTRHRNKVRYDGIKLDRESVTWWDRDKVRHYEIKCDGESATRWETKDKVRHDEIKCNTERQSKT